MDDKLDELLDLLRRPGNSAGASGDGDGDAAVAAARLAGAPGMTRPRASLSRTVLRAHPLSPLMQPPQSHPVQSLDSANALRHAELGGGRSHGLLTQIVITTKGSFQILYVTQPKAFKNVIGVLGERVFERRAKQRCRVHSAALARSGFLIDGFPSRCCRYEIHLK